MYVCGEKGQIYGGKCSLKASVTGNFNDSMTVKVTEPTTIRMDKSAKTFGKQNRSRKQKRKINNNMFPPFLDLEENIVNFCFSSSFINGM